MESTKQPASSSSSLALDLSCDKFSVSSGISSSSSGLVDSVCPPASMASVRDYLQCDIRGPFRKQEPEGQDLDTKKQITDGISPSCLISLLNRDNYLAYQPEKIEPCFLSSSLYYGGQDICNQPQSSQTYTDRKDGEDDFGNSNAASRGNWWQGSLYY